jgi:AraC-like DNA-binding protein
MLPKWKVSEDCGDFLDTDDELAWDVAAPLFRAGVLQIGIINRKDRIRTKLTKTRDNHFLVGMLQGDLSIRMDGQTTSLQPGDVAIIPANTPYIKTGRKGSSFSHIHVKFQDTQRWRVLSERGPQVGPCESMDLMYLLIWRICGAYEARDVLALQHANRDSYTLLDLLLLEVSRTNTQFSAEFLALKDLVSRIRANPARHWTNEEMAASVHMSGRTFHRVFKREFGTTPNAMVIKQRMMLAKRLLTFTDDKVESVGRKVGYANRSVFSELFLKHVGVRPESVRR